MGKPSLILAALATDALPDVNFTSVQSLDDYQAEVQTLVLTAADGEQFLLKAPLTLSAATNIGSEIRAYRALKSVSLPFRISAFLGESSAKALRKVYLFEYLSGKELNLESIKAQDPLIPALAMAIAQIHSIPVSLISDAGLPEYAPAQSVRTRVAEFDRVMDTGKVHRDLLERWQAAIMDINLFRYQPSVIHGDLSGQSILSDGNQIVGVTDWSNLRIDDPAVDFAALFREAETDVFEALILAYEGYLKTDRNLRQRANLYYELSFASDLLYAIGSQSVEDVAEAERMLAILLEDLEDGLLPALTPTEFTATLSETVTPISAAASFTSPISVITENLEVIDLGQAQSDKPEEELS